MWYIEAWEKRADRLALEIELPRLKVGAVRRLFGVKKRDPVYGGLRPLHVAHLAELVRFARRPVSAARLRNYECYLGHYLESWDSPDDPRFRRDHPSPRVLPAFPEAVRVKPQRGV